jgi:hypothetical protein
MANSIDCSARQRATSRTNSGSRRTARHRVTPARRKQTTRETSTTSLRTAVKSARRTWFRSTPWNVLEDTQVRQARQQSDGGNRYGCKLRVRHTATRDDCSSSERRLSDRSLASVIAGLRLSAGPTTRFHIGVAVATCTDSQRNRPFVATARGRAAASSRARVPGRTRWFDRVCTDDSYINCLTSSKSVRQNGQR